SLSTSMCPPLASTRPTAGVRGGGGGVGGGPPPPGGPRLGGEAAPPPPGGPAREGPAPKDPPRPPAGPPHPPPPPPHAPSPPRPRMKPQAHPAPPPRQPPQRPLRVRRDHVEVDHLADRRPPAAQQQELAGHVSGTMAGPGDLHRHLAGVVVDLKHVQQKLGVAD